MTDSLRVQRYSLTECGRGHMSYQTMKENEWGEYVEIEDYEKLQAKLDALENAMRDRSCLACEVHHVLYTPKDGCTMCKLDAMTKERDAAREDSERNFFDMHEAQAKLDTAVKALRDMPCTCDAESGMGYPHDPKDSRCPATQARDALAKIDTDTKGTI